MVNINLLELCVLCSTIAVCQAMGRGEEMTVQATQNMGQQNGDQIKLVQQNDNNCYGSCLVCDTTNIRICFVCNVGFVLIANGDCMQCPPNCVTCQGRTLCTECFPGYSLVRQAQMALCVTCGPGCQQCMALPIATGYLMELTTCSSCFPGFYLTQAVSQYPITECTPCITGCYRCNSGNSCMQCVSGMGYYSDNNTCTACPYPRCLSCNSGICQKCSTGYYLVVSDDSPTGCAPCADNCLSCNSPQQCARCVPGYYVSQANDTSSCEACVKPCIACKNLTVCLACTGSYYLEMIITNETVPQIQQSYCSNCVANCYKCVNSTACVQCQAQFYINGSGQCSACTSPCLTCISENICTSCIDQYYLNFTQCMHCGDNCVFCETIVISFYVQVVCLACVSNLYALESDKCSLCIQVTQGCITCISPTICLSCAEGYLLVDSQCQYQEQGLGAVYIVLFCIAGIIALGAIAFAIWACWRHRNGYGSPNAGGDSGVRSSYLQIP